MAMLFAPMKTCIKVSVQVLAHLAIKCTGGQRQLVKNSAILEDGVSQHHNVYVNNFFIYSKHALSEIIITIKYI